MAMPGTFIDGYAESEQFMSFPVTPTANDDTFFFGGELVHDLGEIYLLFFKIALDPSPASAQVSEPSPRPPTPRDTANGEDILP